MIRHMLMISFLPQNELLLEVSKHNCFDSKKCVRALLGYCNPRVEEWLAWQQLSLPRRQLILFCIIWQKDTTTGALTGAGGDLTVIFV